MIDENLLSVIFVMIMVVIILIALLSLEGKKRDYFWYIFVFGSLFGIVGLVLVLIK